MPEYKWALGNGDIVSADYNRTDDSLSNEQVLAELQSAFQQFGHSVHCEPVSDQLPEVYTITFDDATLGRITVCAKGTTPGGRSNLNDEQRTQQKSKYINYAHSRLQAGESAVQLGVYRRDGQTVFCAWKLKQSSAGAETPVSKQIKITTIAQAMKEGFVQQDKGSGEYACAFRKEFMYFYIRNAEWLHGSLVTELADHNNPLPDSSVDNETAFRVWFTELEKDNGEHLEWVEISEETLAEKALVSTKLVQRLRNNPAYPKNVDCVVAVCIGMNLPPELSNALISRSGFTLRLAQNEAHLMYNFFLNHLYMGSIHECNDMLVAKNLPVMTGTE